MFATITAWLRSQGRTAAVVKINQHRLVCSFPWNFNPITQPPLVLVPVSVNRYHFAKLTENLVQDSTKNVRRHTSAVHPGLRPPRIQARVDQEPPVDSWELQDREGCCSAATLHASSAALSESIKKATEKWTFVDCVAFDFSVFCIIYVAVALPLKGSSLNVTVNISPRCHPETKRPLQKHTKERFGPLGRNKRDPGPGWIQAGVAWIQQLCWIIPLERKK